MKLFEGYLDMCMTASLVMLAVLLLRRILAKLPKRLICVLWMAVLFRLLCPWAAEGPIPNLWARNGAEITDVNTVDGRESASGAIGKKESEGSPDMPGMAGSGEPGANLAGMAEPGNAIEKWSKTDGAAGGAQGGPEGAGETLLSDLSWKGRIQLLCGAIVLAGMGIFLAMGALRYCAMAGRLRAAVKGDPGAAKQIPGLQAEILECGGIQSPMVFGLLRPRIYLPMGFAENMEEEEYGLILAHEAAHIRRGDVLMKLLSWSALSIHWWNPLVWVCMALFQRDMEMACDEAVMARYRPEAATRKKYANALLHYSMKRSGLLFFAAFGESNTEQRVKNILKYRKRSVAYTALALCAVGILVICLVTNPNRGHGSQGGGNNGMEPGAGGTPSNSGGGNQGMEPGAGGTPSNSGGGDQGMEPGAGGTPSGSEDGNHGSDPGIGGTPSGSGDGNNGGGNQGSEPGIGGTAPNHGEGNSGDSGAEGLEELQERFVNVLFADVTHDGVEDAIVTTVDPVVMGADDPSMTAEELLKRPVSVVWVRVYDGAYDGIYIRETMPTDQRQDWKPSQPVIWEGDYAIPHAGNGILFLTWKDGEAYLMEMSAWMGQGYASYGYEVFYLDSSGQVHPEEKAEGPNFRFVDGEYPGQEILDYTKQISPWMEEGIVVVGFADVARKEMVSLPGRDCTMESWEIWSGILGPDLTSMEDVEKRLGL